jgi:hypothetical protein
MNGRKRVCAKFKRGRRIKVKTRRKIRIGGGERERAEKKVQQHTIDIVKHAWSEYRNRDLQS